MSCKEKHVCFNRKLFCFHGEILWFPKEILFLQHKSYVLLRRSDFVTKDILVCFPGSLRFYNGKFRETLGFAEENARFCWFSWGCRAPPDSSTTFSTGLRPPDAPQKQRPHTTTTRGLWITLGLRRDTDYRITDHSPGGQDL